MPNIKLAIFLPQKIPKNVFQECVNEFISFIVSEASERCHQEKQKTISGEDILFATSALGFDMKARKLYLQMFREATKGEKSIGGGVSAADGLSEELTDKAFTHQLPAGLTSDGQQQNVMVYETPYQQISGVWQIHFLRSEERMEPGLYEERESEQRHWEEVRVKLHPLTIRSCNEAS